ncbi:MAG: histidinol-phosphate transaminase [Actinobacteria bacterium RBG_16_68_21]|nr:MAG: histidinol-phosphate transaminase [Actinobacteria bacterium RBG_16_68_21]
MPIRFRSDLETIDRYRPGRPIAEVTAEYGIADVVKLASNESPDGPFPEVQAAIVSHLQELNRYPDNAKPLLTAALAAHLGIAPERIWTGSASNELTLIAALAMGGPGTSAVFGWPSFGLYRTGSRTAFADDVAVPLTPDHRHDLDAMRAAVRANTTVVYVCNPNNPTSTHVPGSPLEAFIDSLPEDVLIVIDEAYAEFATAPDFRSMLPMAAVRPNVMVTRTFSKVYGLAGLRVGYAVTDPSSIAEFRRLQLPFSVNALGEVAAAEALQHQDRVAARVRSNTEAVAMLTVGLAERAIPVADSQANFVYADFRTHGPNVAEELMRRGVIVRPVLPDGWLRITAGTPAENQRFLNAVDAITG